MERLDLQFQFMYPATAQMSTKVSEHGLNNTKRFYWTPESFWRAGPVTPVNPESAYWDIDLILIYFNQDTDGNFSFGLR